MAVLVASGFFQAGNLGGVGLGGGAGLWLAHRLPEEWMVGAVLGITCLACCSGLLFLKGPKSTIRESHFSNTNRNLLKDVWVTLKTKTGILALFLCYLSIGTGSASSLWSAISKDWGVIDGETDLEILAGFIHGRIVNKHKKKTIV